MLPKQIQMKNFGPYVDETVDFEALVSGGLFLITGDTGAGKTTILDAMSFALFGKTTGEKRMAKEFRSHFADIEAKLPLRIKIILILLLDNQRWRFKSVMGRFQIPKPKPTLRFLMKRAN